MASKELDRVGQDADLITGETLPQIEDREASSRSIVEEILKAHDMAELFRGRSTIATKDLVGVPLQISGIRLMRSTLEEKEGVWMLIRAVRLDTGEVIAVNTGARNVMAILYRAQQLGRLPVEVTVIAAGRKRPGENALLGLAPYGKTAEEVEAAERAA